MIRHFDDECERLMDAQSQVCIDWITNASIAITMNADIDQTLFIFRGPAMCNRDDHIGTGIPMGMGIRLRLANTYGEVTSQSLWSRYDRHFVGITRYTALRGEDSSCYWNKIESVSLRKCPHDHRLTNRVYLCAITVASISQSFYLQDGGKNQLA